MKNTMAQVPFLFVILFSFAQPAHSAKIIYGKDKAILPEVVESYEKSDIKMLHANDADIDVYKNIGAMIAWPDYPNSRSVVCTGTLLDTADYIKDGTERSPAYVITAGHCFHRNDPNGIYIGEWPPFDALISLGYFIDGNPTEIRVRLVHYATMNGNDVALVELSGVTYQNLVKLGYKGIKLAKTLPVGEAALESVGIPLYPSNPKERVPKEKQFLHQTACTFYGKYAKKVLIANVETTLPFHFRERIAYDGSMFMGFSGGPLISKESGAIIGVNAQASSLPVEAIKSMPEALRPFFKGQVNDASNVTLFDTCFNESGAFDLKYKGCSLEKKESDDATACESGDGRKCFAERNYAKGCELGEPFSCSALSQAVLLDYKKLFLQTPVDQKTWIAQGRIACLAGMTDSCEALAQLALVDAAHAIAMGAVESSEEANSFLDEACRNGSGWSCATLGLNEKSGEKKITHLLVACFLGAYDDACDELAKEVGVIPELKDTVKDILARKEKIISSKEKNND